MKKGLNNMKNTKKILDYCAYCKDPIYKNEAYTKDKDGIYHPFCYSQEHSYTDDFGTYSIDETEG